MVKVDLGISLENASGTVSARDTAAKLELETLPSDPESQFKTQPATLETHQPFSFPYPQSIPRRLSISLRGIVLLEAAPPLNPLPAEISRSMKLASYSSCPKSPPRNVARAERAQSERLRDSVETGEGAFLTIGVIGVIGDVPAAASLMIQRHPVYWLDDGDSIFHQKASETIFKIHSSKLDSSKLLSDSLSDAFDALKGQTVDGQGLDGCSRYVVLDPIEARDFVALLDSLYGNKALSADSTLAEVSSILRVTGPSQLDLPVLHEQARHFFEDLCPKDAFKLATFEFHDSSAEEAMALSIQYDIDQCQKSLLYYLASETHLDASTFPTTIIPPTLTSQILQHGHALESILIERFTPLLFTPPPTSHMECTDVLAEQWMPLVITPAIADSAMGKPLQTLEKMKSIPWGKYGICDSCVKEKLDEWSEEQNAVWELLDGSVWGTKAPEVL
ncbi:hypothetical protein D9757_005008 [Collybiopsis confluens]|uniref:BTB domain-containing protein n=1 Tax=Collybiopsis confluens TaxID=2823264 RepID=A0A8H5HTR9_9AGAR|nr:hypothetical protein D9757_005008 [Collybiopsis confluens]